MRRPLALALVVTSWLVAAWRAGTSGFRGACRRSQLHRGRRETLSIAGPAIFGPHPRSARHHGPHAQGRGARLSQHALRGVRSRPGLLRRTRANQCSRPRHGSLERPPPLQAADVRVTVRPSSYVDDLAQRGDATNFVAEPLIDDLWVIGVRDEPTTIATLGSADLKALGLTSNAALALGKRNLEDSLKRRIAAAVGRAQAGEALAMRGDDYSRASSPFPNWDSSRRGVPRQALCRGPRVRHRRLRRRSQRQEQGRHVDHGRVAADACAPPHLAGNLSMDADRLGGRGQRRSQSAVNLDDAGPPRSSARRGARPSRLSSPKRFVRRRAFASPEKARGQAVMAELVDALA